MQGGGSSSSSTPSCFAACAGTLSSCLPGWLGGSGVAVPKNLTPEEFQELIGFLGAVPLLRKHVPKAQLPKLARAFKLTAWAPGTKVMEVGKPGTTFFIIRSGEAEVLLENKLGGLSAGPTLYTQDYFGGRALTETRPNFATIVAKGPTPLVTLSMCKQDFFALGLNRSLKFPRRPAIYEGRRTDRILDAVCVTESITGRESDSTALEPDEVEFLDKALRANPNLKKALGEVDESKIRGLAELGKRQRIRKGTKLGLPGELPAHLFIVCSGSFDVISGTAAEHVSAEAKVSKANRTKKQIRLKQQFIEHLEWNAVTMEKRITDRMCRVFSTGNASPKEKLSLKRRSVSITALVGAERILASPFKAGDKVARVVVGDGDELTQEIGCVMRVVEHGTGGSVEVSFGGNLETVGVTRLRPVPQLGPVAKLTRGMAYGCLALLYNTRLTTSCVAAENSVVYCISSSDFKQKLSKQDATLEEHYHLLDEVHLLSVLLQSQRREMAESAAGVYRYQAGERILEEQVSIEEIFFYVIKTGSAIISKDGEAIATLRYPSYFGERTILSGRKAPEYSVTAGPAGLTLLAIRAEYLRAFLSPFLEDASDQFHGWDEDVSSYFKLKPQGRSAAQELPFANLKLQKLIGEGGFGSVFRVQDRESHREYALKRLSKGYVMRAEATKQVCLERDILALLDSNFVIKLYRTYKDHEYVYMLLELCDGGHLFDIFSSYRMAGCSLPPDAVRFYIGSVAIALGHMHDSNIAYRDVKAENVLLDSEGFVKICDMGFAKFIVGKSNTLLGTPEYMAPEMIDPPHSHDHMIDWWALGVLMFELLTGQDCFTDMGLDSEDPMAQILAMRECHDEGIHEHLLPSSEPAAKDMVRRLLTVNPRRRLGAKGDAKEIKFHAWFTSAHFDCSKLERGAIRPPSLDIPRRSPPGSPVLTEMSPSEAMRNSSLFAPVMEDTSDWDAAF